MRVAVEGIDALSKCLSITFRAAGGRAKARWNSSRHRPSVGDSLSCELDVDLDIKFGVNASVSEDGSALEAHDGYTTIRGVVESIDEDGMLFLRLSEDCLLMVQSRGFPPDLGTRISFQVTDNDLVLTPI